MSTEIKDLKLNPEDFWDKKCHCPSPNIINGKCTDCAGERDEPVVIKAKKKGRIKKT